MKHRRILPYLAWAFLAAHSASAQQEATSRDSLDFVRISTIYCDILRRTSDVQEFSLTMHGYTVTGSFSLGGGRLETLLRRAIFDLNNHNHKTDLDISFFGKNQSLSVGYRLRFGNVEIAASAEVSEEHQHLALNGAGSIAVGFPLTILEEIRLGLRQQSQPFDFRTAYLDSELPLSQTMRLTSVEASVVLNLIPNNRLQLHYARSETSPNALTSPFTLRDKTESHEWNASLQQAMGSWHWSLLYDRGTVESTSDFYHEGNTFGESSFSDAHTEGVYLRFARKTEQDEGVGAYGGYRTFQGTLVGNLQSWPFFSILQSVIANRINFRMTGSVDYWHVGVENTWHFGSIAVRTSVTYYDVKPDISLQSWQPLFLVVGVSQFTENRLEVIHAGLGQLELAVRLNAGEFDAELRGMQIVPLFQDRRAAEILPGPSDGGVVRESSVSTDGGRLIQLTVLLHI